MNSFKYLVASGPWSSQDYISIVLRHAPNEYMLTERHLGEEVVDDVEVGNTVEEEVAHCAEEVTVDGSSSTAGVRPLLIAVVGQLGVGVVEVGDHDEPVVDAEPWNAVVLDDVCETVLEASDLYCVHHRENTKVGDDHNVALGLSEDDGVSWIVLDVSVICKMDLVSTTHDHSGLSTSGMSFGRRR